MFCYDLIFVSLGFKDKHVVFIGDSQQYNTGKTDEQYVYRLVIHPQRCQNAKAVYFLILLRVYRLSTYVLLNIFNKAIVFPYNYSVNQRSAMSIESNHTHNFWYLYAFILISIWNMESHIQSLKYSAYSYLTTRMIYLISTLHNSTHARITK